MKLTVILPTRNEEVLIQHCIKDISSFLNKKEYSYEILVVTNGCTDNTLEIVRGMVSKNKNIKIVNSKPGYGYALKKGMSVAKGDFVVIFNVDFYDLKMIDLVDIDLYGRDLVMGSKMAHWSEDRRNTQRRVFSYVYNLLLKFLFGFKGSDTHGIKVMRKEVAAKVLKKCKTVSGIMDTEFVIRAQRDNFKIADFPVVVEEKRGPRFDNRLWSTPIDIYNLYKVLK